MGHRAELTIHQGGTQTTIPCGDRFQLGSAPGADVVLTGPGIAPTHLSITWSPAGALLVVSGPEGGERVRLNTLPVQDSQLLEHGDRIAVGGVTVVYQTPSRQETPRRLSIRSSEGDSQAFSWNDPATALERTLFTLHRCSKLFCSASGESSLLEGILREGEQGFLAQGAAVVGRSDQGTPIELYARGKQPECLQDDGLTAALEEGRSSLVPRPDGGSCLVVPIGSGAGRAERALVFQRPPELFPFVREELELASSLGRQLGVALERVRVLKKLHKRNLEFTRLQRRLEAVLGTIVEGLALVTPKGMVGPLSPRGRDLLIHLGWDPDSTGPLPASSPLLPLVDRALKGIAVLQKDVDTGEHVVEVSATRAAPLTAVVLVLRDVTAERRRERRQQATERRLRREVLEVSAREQRRIGQDLHDGLCQTLVAVGMLARTLGDTLAERSLPEAGEAEQIAAHLSEATTTARGLARGLTPVAFEAHGLAAALEELAHDTARLTGVACSFEPEEEVLVADDAAAIHLYYIAREAINNALRHGESGHIRIRLQGDPAGVTLVIEDDGRGFRRGVAAAADGGMGLHIMKHRAQTMGGTLVVESNPAGGTSVVCSVPVPSADAEGADR